MASDLAYPPLTLAKADLCFELRCSERHLDGMRAAGKLPRPVRIGIGGRSDRYLRSDIDLWLRLGCPSAADFEVLTIE